MPLSVLRGTSAAIGSKPVAVGPARVVRRFSLLNPLIFFLAACLFGFPGASSGTYVVFTTDVCWSCGTDFDGI